ncbi:VOC family protein [Aerococcaceae bacterium DSM 109652]|uniref:VOC family protein n=1 Tax=Fundicoccus ignavus TaxID=2664442 RepID=A0A844C6Z0_9LACT|nr:VOC family protein [Fundicoccus ignavus]
MRSVPYLNFQYSLEALAFYEKLGATIATVTKMSDPIFADMPEEERLNSEFVMNASFTMFDRLIYCSDSWGNQPVDHAGSNLCFTFDQNNDDDIAQIELLFAKAEELGCEITMPLEAVEWSERFGMFRDPFGVTWLLSGE